jgi:hypothetical protein
VHRPFAALKPGDSYLYLTDRFVAADVRTARCTGGEGELPFRVANGWQARVGDFRCGEKFLTLDYSEGSPPALYLGEATTLEEWS